MAVGPGKYDAACTYVRERHHALAAIVIVMRGDQGDGFSAQGPQEILEVLPEILEHVAAEMRNFEEPPLTRADIDARLPEVLKRMAAAMRKDKP